MSHVLKAPAQATACAGAYPHILATSRRRVCESLTEKAKATPVPAGLRVRRASPENETCRAALGTVGAKIEMHTAQDRTMKYADVGNIKQR